MTHTLNGLVRMTNAEYHSSPGISKSHLDDIARSPLHYWGKRIDPDREVSDDRNDDLVLGSATHTATLEPDLFDSEYLVMPDFNLRSPKGLAARDEWVESEVKGREYLTPAQRETALAIAAAVRRHPDAGPLLQRGVAEQSWFATDRETGALVKCRRDWWNPDAGLTLDLKTTKDASPEGFAKSVFNFRYHVQQAFYDSIVFEQLYGEAPPYWAFVAVEKVKPYAVAVYQLEAEDVERGYLQARRDLERLVSCLQSGVWPGYTSMVERLSLPGWARRQIDNQTGVL